MQFVTGLIIQIRTRWILSAGDSGSVQTRPAENLGEILPTAF
jgi:hypothetical protein